MIKELKNIRHDYSNELKLCPKCKKEKPRTHEYFFKEAKNKDGFNYLCKECKKEIDKESRNNSDKFALYQKSPRFVYLQLKYQAKKRNMPFELDFSYYEQNLANKPCHYCGSNNTKHWVDRHNNDHAIGYTKENTVPCCELCNKMKVKLSPEVFINHCKSVADHNS